MNSIPNELSRRIGDVLAIDRVYIDTIEKARPLFNEKFGEDSTSRKILTLRHHAEILDWIITKLKINTAALEESQEKIRVLFKLREVHSNDNWTEESLGEWLGFFFGGAIVNWSNLKKSNNEEIDEDLTHLIQKSLLFYRQGLDEILNI